MRKKIFVTIGILAAVLIILAGVYLFSKWNHPLGESLAMATRTPLPGNVVIATEVSASGNEDVTPTAGLISADTTQVIPTDQPLCGGPPVQYILGIGADSDDEEYLYGLADVIRVARVDYVTPKVTVLTVPRDLWVTLPDIVEKYAEFVTHAKLNQAYLYGGPGMGYYDGPGGGPGLLARTLAFNYDLYVDNYGAINMQAFVRIIDALGGIDIYLEKDWDGRPVDDQTIDLGYFRAGQHHMTGDEALRFSRIRKKYSEVARTDNQSLVICAVKDKLLTPAVVGKIPNLINSLMGTIQTDLTPAQISQLTCLLPKLSGENLQFVRLPDEWMVQSRVYDPVLKNTTFVWDIPVEDIQKFVIDFQNDAIAPDEGEGMSCP